MPKKISAIDKAAQARNARLKKKLAAQKIKQKLQERERREMRQARDMVLRDILRKAKGKGIYEPKSFELTKYRVTKARKILRDYGDFLDPSKYFFVKPKAKQQKEFNERANALNMKTTNTGLFIAKEGHKKARVKVDRKNKELYIERSGKKKRGAGGELSYRAITPLASIDALDNERERLRRMAASLGPLGKNERLIFTVHENGIDGFSHNTYSNIEILLRGLEEYQKSGPAKIQFFRHVTVEKRSLHEYHDWRKKVWQPELEAKRKIRLKQYGKEYRSRVTKLKPKGK